MCLLRKYINPHWINPQETETLSTSVSLTKLTFLHSPEKTLYWIHLKKLTVIPEAERRAEWCLKAFTHAFFSCEWFEWKNIFQTNPNTNWAWAFSHRKRISFCEKAKPFIFHIEVDFQNILTGNKCISQSRWLCRADITSLSHINNINSSGCKLITCVSQHQVLFGKQHANCKDNNLRQHMAEYHWSVGLCKWWVTLPYVVYFWMR